MDPLRYVDLQMEVCHQLARRNDSFLNSMPNNSRYNELRQAAAQIQEQDRRTFEQATRNIKDTLERQLSYLRQAPNPARQRAIEERLQKLEEYRQAFYGGR